MDIKDKDFVEIDFDIYANGELVQTTDEKKGKENNLDVKKYGPETIVVGSGFILKALDEHIIKNKQDKKHSMELTPEEAYGKRDKKLIKTFPKSAFDEQQMRAVVGVTYDFNGMYGTVKSVTGGRVMVDFNNPLSGKDIKLEYKVNKKITDITKKIETVFTAVLRIPTDMFKISAKDKEVTLQVPQQLVTMKEMLQKSLEELISDIKDYKLKVELFKTK